MRDPDNVLSASYLRMRFKRYSAGRRSQGILASTPIVCLMTVPFLDVGAAYRELEHPIDAAITRVLRSGRFILGPEVESFERGFAAYTAAKHCVGVGNGLEALALALAAHRIGPGDEVIVPAATAVPTWLAVTHVGAVPVPAAVCESTWTLDPDRLDAAITRRTRAVIPVHLYGHPADLGPICDMARRYGLVVIDDAAQAHGARYRDRPIGALVSATAFSFYPSKNLGAIGDGGAVTTDDDAIAARVRMLGNYGGRDKYDSELPGWNSRLDPLQAAVLGVKLKKLDEWNARRRVVAARYHDALAHLTWLQLPHEAEWARHVYHLFVVRVPDRAALVRHLSGACIEMGVHYPIPPYRQRVFRHLGSVADGFPELDAAHHEVLSLPMGPHLTEEQQDRVIEAIASFNPAGDSPGRRSTTAVMR
jgi:dTDP-4-amino-4,6-dideoxygalactose transaminase